MYRILGVLAVAGCMVSSGAIAQAPANGMAGAQASGPASEMMRSYEGVKKNILKAADNMPAENYSSKPEPDVRTFARVVNHISEAQLHSCGIVNGTTNLAKVPPETADKAAIVEALHASFAECDKAYGSATDGNLGDMMDAGKTKRSRVGLLWGNASHDSEQYATLALYMRLKGLTPPSSEK